MFEGVPYTWQCREVRQRLDRILFNHLWLDTFASSKVTHGIRRCSDHTPLLIESIINPVRRKGQFRFQDMWLKHPECVKSIESNWNLPARKQGLKKLWEKLHRLKQYLQWWNRHVFENFFSKLQEEEAKVSKAEVNYNVDPSDANLYLVRKTSEEFQKILDMEEVFWRQKAHCRWNIEGDKTLYCFTIW